MLSMQRNYFWREKRKKNASSFSINFFFLTIFIENFIINIKSFFKQFCYFLISSKSNLPNFVYKSFWKWSREGSWINCSWFSHLFLLFDVYGFDVFVLQLISFDKRCSKKSKIKKGIKIINTKKFNLLFKQTKKSNTLWLIVWPRKKKDLNWTNEKKVLI